MSPHLTSLEFLVLAGLVAAWRLPDWLMKFVRLADALRRFQLRWPRTRHPRP